MRQFSRSQRRSAGKARQTHDNSVLGFAAWATSSATTAACAARAAAAPGRVKQARATPSPASGRQPRSPAPLARAPTRRPSSCGTRASAEPCCGSWSSTFLGREHLARRPRARSSARATPSSPPRTSKRGGRRRDRCGRHGCFDATPPIELIGTRLLSRCASSRDRLCDPAQFQRRERRGVGRAAGGGGRSVRMDVQVKVDKKGANPANAGSKGMRSLVRHARRRQPAASEAHRQGQVCHIRETRRRP